MTSLPKFQKAGRHSWAVIGHGDDVFHSYGSNQGFVLGEDTGLVFDSGFYNRPAASILRRIRAGGRTLMLVDSHYHSDHVFGNSVFSDHGIPIIAHEGCNKTMRLKTRKLLDGYRKRDPRLSGLLRGVKAAYPNISYHDSATANLGNDLDADIIYGGLRAHTNGDSIVHVEKDGVVFAGDVLWVGYHPNLEDADIQGQIRALRMILRLKPRRIVPGHGPVSRIGDVRRAIKYLEELDRNIRSGLRKSLREDELVHHVIPRWSWKWKMRWLMESYIRSLAGKN